MNGFKIWRASSVVQLQDAVEIGLEPNWDYGNTLGQLEEMELKLYALNKHASLIGRLVSVLCEKKILSKQDIAFILGDGFDVRDIAPGDSE